MNILTLGNGFISSHLPYPTILDRVYPDIHSIADVIINHKPDVLINTIGYCGKKNIDDCLDNKTKTIQSNIIIPTMLADECNYRGIKFIHIGSGCINYGESRNTKITWDGPVDTGWKETDPTMPKSFYSKTKLAADLAINAFDTSTILRIRMPVSWKNNPRNLLSKLIKYQKVVEEPNSMTFMDDLVRGIKFAIDKDLHGIYHLVHPTPIKHSLLLDEYCKHKPNHRYEKISADELDLLVKETRSNCILNCDKIVNEGFEFGDINVMVQEYVGKFVVEQGK